MTAHKHTCSMNSSTHIQAACEMMHKIRQAMDESSQTLQLHVSF